MSAFTMHELIENYGPIMASDQDFGLLVQVNGSYFNVYRATGQPGFYESVEAYDFESRIESKNGLYGADFAKVLDKAQEILKMHVEMEEG